jgi:carboxymethylenebutenolidase
MNGRGFFIPSPKKSDRYLLVFHEWWGLNDYIEREAERWRQELGDVNVIAVDLFDGKVATTPEAAQKQTGEANPVRMANIINGAIAYAGPHAKIATIGWCFGGGWALQASLLAGAQTKATVMYYGMPELDVKKLRTLHGPVIEFFGSKDQFINQQKAVAFQKAAKATKKRLFEYTYTADHGFANPSNPKYDKAATASAHVKALAFLKEYFLK